MSPRLMECQANALKLPPADRAILAEISDEQNEQLWLDEADRRYREYKSGSISARPAEDVLRDARGAIK